jgi:hypothetical protein
MNELEAKEEIRLIQEMIQKTRQATAESGTLFFFWGIWVVLAIIGNYVLVFLEKYSWIWLNWTVFVVLGMIYSGFYSIRQEKRQAAATYVQMASRYLAIACAVGYVLLGLVFPLFNLYSYGVIPVLIAVMAGIELFGIGGIYEWNLLKWCAAVWWLGSLGMLLVHVYYRTLVFVPLIILAYLLPARVLRSKYLKRINGHAS